jgi:hypothetical protein
MRIDYSTKKEEEEFKRQQEREREITPEPSMDGIKGEIKY